MFAIIEATVPFFLAGFAFGVLLPFMFYIVPEPIVVCVNLLDKCAEKTAAKLRKFQCKLAKIWTGV